MVLITENPAIAGQKICEIARRFDLDGPRRPTYGSVSHLEDVLQGFPISTKQGLISFRKNNADAYLNEAILFAETSGTTGKPLQIPRTQFDLINGVRNYAKAYTRYLTPGRDRLAFIHPSHLSPLRDITVRTLQDHNIGVMTVFPIPGVYSYERIHAALENNKMTTLMSSPSIILQTLYNFHLEGLAFPSSIERVFVTGEYFTLAQASNIRRLVGRTIDIVPIVYGANEIGMMMYGDADLSYRGFESDFVFESLPLEDPGKYVGELAANTHLGELLVTGLTPSAMPIVRYATKDVFAFTQLEDGSWRFQHIGRNEQLPLNLRTRNLIDDAMYSLPRPIFHYSIILKQDASEITVQVLPVEDNISTVARSVIAALSDIVPNLKINIDSIYEGGFKLGACTSKINRFSVAA